MSDIHAWRQGSCSLIQTASRYYAAGFTADFGGTGAFTINCHALYAMPYISGRSGVVDRLACYVVNSAGGRAQLGIYTVSCAQNFYPQSLMLSGSDCDMGTSGLQQIMTICSFVPDTMYWFAILSNCSPGLRRVQAPYAIFGTDANTAAIPRPFIVTSYGYGVLPAQFPTTVGCAVSLVSCLGTPMLAVRYMN